MIDWQEPIHDNKGKYSLYFLSIISVLQIKMRIKLIIKPYSSFIYSVSQLRELHPHHECVFSSLWDSHTCAKRQEGIYIAWQTFHLCPGDGQNKQWPLQRTFIMKIRQGGWTLFFPVEYTEFHIANGLDFVIENKDVLHPPAPLLDLQWQCKCLWVVHRPDYLNHVQKCGPGMSNSFLFRGDIQQSSL